jgi:hypothetical protein
MTMVIEIRGIRRDPALRARVEKQVQAALERLQLKPITAQATFFDDNGPKGGLAIRCALTARLPYRPALRVEQTEATQRTAFLRYLLISFRAFLLSDVLNRHIEVFPVDVVPYM